MMRFVVEIYDGRIFTESEISVWYSQLDAGEWEKRQYLAGNALRGYIAPFDVWTETSPLTTFHMMKRYLMVWESVISFSPRWLLACSRHDSNHTIMLR